MFSWLLIATIVVSSYSYQAIEYRPDSLPYDVWTVVKYFPPDEQQHAADVFWCETHWDNFVVGKAGEVSIAQIHPIWMNKYKLYGYWYLDYELVGQIAANIWWQSYIQTGNGWLPWSGCS